MKFFRLLNKDLLALLISIIFSLILFFNNNSNSVVAVQADIADIVNFLTYPQRWYKDVFYIKELNKYLELKLIQSNLLNARLNNLIDQISLFSLVKNIEIIADAFVLNCP